MNNSATSDEALVSLLQDPDCPAAHLIRGGGAVVVRVADLAGFVSARTGESEGIEATLDSFVQRMGGERRKVIDLDDLPRRAWRRLFGKPGNPVEEVYELPPEVFGSEGGPRKLALPPKE